MRTVRPQTITDFERQLSYGTRSIQGAMDRQALALITEADLHEEVLEPANDWTPRTGTQVRLFRDKWSRAQLVGELERIPGGVPTNTIVTVPDGFRPERTYIFPAAAALYDSGAGGTAQPMQALVSVFPNGVVLPIWDYQAGLAVPTDGVALLSLSRAIWTVAPTP